MTRLGKEVQAPGRTKDHPGQIDQEMGRVRLDTLTQRGPQDRHGGQIDLTDHPQHDDLARSVGVGQ